MTEVRFFAHGKTLTGFQVKGHATANSSDDKGKTVCAAVSSAAYMAVNTVTEIIGDKADAEVTDAFMCVKVENPSEKSVAVLQGFKLHITELAKQYSNSIKVYSEV